METKDTGPAGPTFPSIATLHQYSKDKLETIVSPVSNSNANRNDVCGEVRKDYYGEIISKKESRHKISWLDKKAQIEKEIYDPYELRQILARKHLIEEKKEFNKENTFDSEAYKR